MPNISYSPEAFGLTVVGTAYDDSLSYEFDEFIVWRDTGGSLRWASDSGCSCPEPFGDVTLDDTGHGTVAEAHAALREWADGTPGKQASAADLLLKLITPTPVPARESYIPDYSGQSEDQED